MIKQEFLDLMESQHYDIGGILHEILKIPTYKAFFEQKSIGIKFTDFRPLGIKGTSTKVMEFISKYENSLLIIGPMHFIEYLLYHHSDNVLKLVIDEKIPPSADYPIPLVFFKVLFQGFKTEFFNEDSIPYVTNLTSTVLADKAYTPIEGRDRELKEIRRQFGKLMKNNVVLTGSGGVGKTALVEEFAMQEMKNYVIYELNVLGLISNGKGALGILDNILEILTNLNGNKVLFIDEFHILIKEGLADTIKRITSRSTDLKFIVATTHDEFKMYVEKDKALERRFHPIPVNEIEGELLEKVLLSWCNKLKFNFNIEFDPSIIRFVIDKMKVERQKTSPDKEKDIIDAAFSGCKLDGINIVDKDAVADVMSTRLSIPKEQLTSTMYDVISNLEENLKKEIKGQDYAIKNVVKVIESSQMVKKRNKPMAVMFFAGDTSVGKTEMARQLAKNLFGSEKNLIQINCTNYKESHTMSALLGSPPGYVGSEKGGSLVNKIKQRPFSVILFDEFEKAHADLQDIMLPMFEEGIITDRSDRIADVTNCVIILTSNLGAGSGKNSKTSKGSSVLKMGFDNMYSEEDYENKQNEATDRYKSYLKSLKNHLKEELIARINEIIIFSKLSTDVIAEIAENQINKLIENYKEEYSMNVTYTKEVVEYIVKKATNNPRKISNAIDKTIKSAVTKAFMKKQIKEGDNFKLIKIENLIALEVEVDA